MVFVVALDNPASTKFKERMHESYPTNFQYTDLLFLVQDDNISEVVAKTLGIKVDDDAERLASGVVFRLEGAYSGYTTRALWDWLSITEGF